MKAIFIVGFCLASALEGNAALAMPDDYWATARGSFYEEDGVKSRTFWTRDCDYELAKKYALSQCERAGGENCQIIEVRQHQCRTKCNCS